MLQFTLFFGLEQMKIVSLITDLDPAGAERVLTELVCNLIARGHSCDVVSLMAPPKDDSLVDALQTAGARVAFLNATKLDFFVLPFLVRYALQKFEPEIVHSHMMHANLLSRLALAGTGVPLVNTIHIADRRRTQGFYFMLDRITVRHANVLTGVSKAAVRFHSAACRIPRKKFRVVYNGCDYVEPASPEECREFRKWCMMEDCTKVIGSVGRLDRQKGYDLLFDRAKAISARVPEGEKWGVIIIGDGPERDELERRARAIEDPKLVFALPGYRSDARNLMAAFDAMVMPSRYEGYGLTLVEAMSLGLPVVTSTVDSLPEICELYRGGFAQCVNFNDDPDGIRLAKALSEAVCAGRSEPCTICSVASMVDQYESIYNELTGN